MAERLATLPATQVARVRFPVPARSTFRVEKVALFCNPASGGTFSSTAIEIIKWVKNIAVAQAKVSHISPTYEHLPLPINFGLRLHLKRNHSSQSFQHAEYLNHLGEAEGRIYFAGEHTDNVHGFMDTAIRSGVRAAAEVHLGADWENFGKTEKYTEKTTEETTKKSIEKATSTRKPEKIQLEGDGDLKKDK
jgi:hypothetical protein